MFLNRSIKTLSIKTFRLLFSQQSEFASSSVGFLKPLSRKPSLLNKSEFKLVYTFNYIPLIVGILRSKTSVPIASFVSCPFLYYFDETHVAPILVAISGTIFFLMGIGVKVLARNVIGKIYVNKEGEIENLIVSSVDANGNRIDRMHTADSFINNDSPNKLIQLIGFTTIVIENTDLMYKLNINNGKLIKPEVCDVLFGRIWNPKLVQKLGEEVRIKK